MSDLDQDLARRLERLSAAVPIRAGELDSVHVSAVRTRREVRMRWLTPLIAILIAVIAVALFGVGSQRPSTDTASDDPTGAPVGMARDGDFALTLRADKGHYAVNEPINAAATLTYFGPDGSVEIHTDDNGPIMFGIRERVFGGIDIGTMRRLMCGQTTLVRGVPLVESFGKSGSFDGENPDAPKFQAWLQAKDLRLPEGTWHLYAISQAPCSGGDPAFNLRAEIEIVVGDPAATPGLPVATNWNDAPVYGGDDIGYMTFQLKSRHPRYEEGTPIDLDAWYSFGEGSPDALRPFVQHLEFEISQSDPASRDLRPLTVDQPDCTMTTMAPNEERHVHPDPRSVVAVRAVQWPDSAEAALRQGQLLLPPGHWRITATVRAIFGQCLLPAERWEVHASVEVDVLPRA